MPVRRCEAIMRTAGGGSNGGDAGRCFVLAVIFDLDGVIVDSEPAWERIRRQVVAENGGRWLADTQKRLMGMSTPEWSRYLSQDLGVALPPDAVAALVIERMSDGYREQVPLMPGAAEAVRRMAERWPLGLASSSPPELIDAALDGAGLEGLFAAIVSTEQVGRGKPAPDVYQAAADRLGFLPERCAAVEDSANGLRSAAAAGLRVIAVPHPRYPPDPSALEAAELVLTGLAELTVDTVCELAGS
jgi:HAD superfamily hydrolase (TIGR01509 family)